MGSILYLFGQKLRPFLYFPGQNRGQNFQFYQKLGSKLKLWPTFYNLKIWTLNWVIVPKSYFCMPPLLVSPPILRIWILPYLYPILLDSLNGLEALNRWHHSWANSIGFPRIWPSFGQSIRPPHVALTSTSWTPPDIFILVITAVLIIPFQNLSVSGSFLPYSHPPLYPGIARSRFPLHYFATFCSFRR